jgi:hypothetical protein
MKAAPAPEPQQLKVVLKAQPLKVWIRLIPFIETDSFRRGQTDSTHLSAGLTLAIYPNKEAAQYAASKRGGLVLEIEASQLSNANPFGNDFGSDISLAEDEDEHPGTSKVWPVACYGSLPFKTVNNEEGEYAEFAPETLEWIDAMEKETGLSLHQ